MDKFISELKNTADKVAKKSGELFELSKVKLGIATTKSEISSNFKILGELIYLAQKDGDNEAYAENIKETLEILDELYEKLDKLTGVSSALKNEKKCPYCGKSNPLDQLFCGGCGQKIASDNADDDGDLA